MRIWNGLRVNDIVVYKGNKYGLTDSVMVSMECTLGL